MTAETRIGIVTGLIIVVAASVYFFYGSDRQDDGILVSTPTRVTVPPKIPVSAEKKATPNRRVARGPSRQPTGPLANNYPQRRQTTPTVPPSPVRVPPVVNRPPANPSDSPVPLRTAPSNELVEATWENLLNRDKPAPQSGQTPAPGASKPPVTTTVQPQPAPASPASPPAGWPKRHTIAAGDTLVDISKEYYGDGSRTADILAANPQIKSARSLKIGDVIALPEPKKTARSSPTAETPLEPVVRTVSAATPSSTPRSGKTYTVQSGDTLYSIARKQCGNKNRWEEIFRLNKDVLKGKASRLSTGMVLKLPE